LLLRILRSRSGTLTQSEFGARIGLTAAQVSRLERGGKTLDVHDWLAAAPSLAWGTRADGEGDPLYLLVSVDPRDLDSHQVWPLRVNDGVVPVFATWSTPAIIAAALSLCRIDPVVALPAWRSLLDELAGAGTGTIEIGEDDSPSVLADTLQELLLERFKNATQALST
jgi:hypothetical protein